ncbi:GGDEF domain-containing protein [Oceanospirillum linum]|uniref:GGDEF domain-containing protein n=1 Tax=Oceanospirillum linum TaxID=966 RepID=UPI00089F4C7C|nr:GGDEF domain-containing protein [Oceanospirillum linum]SEG52252.1 diguanylate cyclase (GGDEF) domain-containing protein [Oleiphilus messinensis]SMP35970.1 diguanylate cyclase (GGDEF) domain-containing protein [Oceanospirillum linum]
MNRILFKLKESALVPLLLLLITIPVAHFGYSAFSPTVKDLISLAPYIVFTAAATLCLVYGRLRVLMTLLTLVIAYWSFTTLLSTVGQSWSKFTIEIVFNAVTILGPLNLLLFAFWQEKGSMVTDLPTKLMVLGAQIFAIWLVCEYQHQPTLFFMTQMLWPALHPDWANISPIAYYFFIISFLAMSGLMLWQPSTINAALFSALIILFIVSQQLLIPGYLSIFMFLAGILLVGAVVHETFNMAFKDDLTGLPGRRALNEQLAKLGRNYTIAMMDVDHFKKFNDTYGHDIGDQVLKMVAAKIKRVTGGGKAFRYGGEEFTILYPNRDVQYALPHLETVRETIANYAMKIRDDNRPQDDNTGKNRRGNRAKDPSTVSVTISIGVSQREGANKTPEQVIKAADDALYRAKHAGRNKVCT